MKRWTRLVVVTIVAAVLWGPFGAWPSVAAAESLSVEQRLSQLEARLAALERAAAISALNVPALVEEAAPSVVSVYNVDEDDAVQGRGTAFIVSEDGLAITNAHVLHAGYDLKVKFHDGTVRPATMLLTDPFLDIAFLMVEGSGFQPLTFASKKPAVGEPIVVIGNAWGYSNSVTVGVISGVDRPDPYHYHHYPSLQTDAAVNHGNSGGPMLNAAGEVVAVATWAELKDQTEGVSFGIPVGQIESALNRFDAERGIIRPWLGLAVQEPYWARGGLTNTLGLFVSGTHPLGAGARAGLKWGDWIREVNGVEVNELMALRHELEQYQPGDVITLLITRQLPSGKFTTLRLPVTLGEYSIAVNALIPDLYDPTTDDLF